MTPDQVDEIRNRLRAKAAQAFKTTIPVLPEGSVMRSLPDFTITITPELQKDLERSERQIREMFAAKEE